MTGWRQNDFVCLFIPYEYVEVHYVYADVWSMLYV